MPTTEIIVRTQFEGFHCWPEAPDDVGFLKNPHRHIFCVEAAFFVSHEERELEFFQVKRLIDLYLVANPFPMRSSCESMANKILTHFINDGYPIRYVSVFEDNENGVKVYI